MSTDRTADRLLPGQMLAGTAWEAVLLVDRTDDGLLVLMPVGDDRLLVVDPTMLPRATPTTSPDAAAKVVGWLPVVGDLTVAHAADDEKIPVRWPDGLLDRLLDLAGDQPLWDGRLTRWGLLDFVGAARWATTEADKDGAAARRLVGWFGLAALRAPEAVAAGLLSGLVGFTGVRLGEEQVEQVLQRAWWAQANLPATHPAGWVARVLTATVQSLSGDIPDVDDRPLPTTGPADGAAVRRLAAAAILQVLPDTARTDALPSNRREDAARAWVDAVSRLDPAWAADVLGDVLDSRLAEWWAAEVADDRWGPVDPDTVAAVRVAAALGRARS